MSQESPEVQELFDLIADCHSLALEFDDVVFRFAGVKYANEEDIVSGEGAGYFGGRWNRPNIKAIYASLDPLTAMRESYQVFTKFGFKGKDIRPRVLAGLRIKACSLLDLTVAAIRRRIGFRLNDLIQEDWHAIQSAGEESWTQAIGRGCRAAGFEGLITPSAGNRGGKNVVIFPDKLRKGSFVDLVLKEELPPHLSKWPK